MFSTEDLYNKINYILFLNLFSGSIHIFYRFNVLRENEKRGNLSEMVAVSFGGWRGDSEGLSRIKQMNEMPEWNCIWGWSTRKWKWKNMWNSFDWYLKKRAGLPLRVYWILSSMFFKQFQQSYHCHKQNLRKIYRVIFFCNCVLNNFTNQN